MGLWLTSARTCRSRASLLSPRQLFQPPAEAESLKLVPFTLSSGLLFARVTVRSCCLVLVVAVVCAKLLQSCLTLCDPMDSSLPGPLSMGFSRPESWRGCHARLQGSFLTQGLRPCLRRLLQWQAVSLPLAPPGKLACCFYKSGIILGIFIL